jgi:hypothetical protein
VAKKWYGCDDSRPDAAKPSPGSIDRTSEGKRKGWMPAPGNVSNNQSSGGKNSSSWKGHSDQRPDSKGSRNPTARVPASINRRLT